MIGLRNTLWLSIVFLLLPLASGCLGPWAKRSADRAAYPIIQAKQVQALGKTDSFTIDRTTDTLTSRVLTDAGETDDPQTTGGLQISLADSLALAIGNNRDYQTRKEQVYDAALALTEQQHDFSPIFSGLISGRAVRDYNETVDLNGDTQIVPERFGTATTDFGVTKLLATGARITVGLSNNFLRYYSGAPRESATGSATASIVQPLLQGAGTAVTLENLRQAERDVIYAVRDFARYQRGFILDRVSAYYGLLRGQAIMDNENDSYKRLIVARQRAEAMQEAGRLASFEVDQARQDEIVAQNRWIVARSNYLVSLDQFRVDLGLPTQLNLQPDPSELNRLEGLYREGQIEIGYELSAAEQRALGQRLDYRTSLNRSEDARRKIVVAENSLLPKVDTRVDWRVDDEGKNQPLDLDLRRRTYSGQLDVELPLDRLQERNDYRRALIAADQRERAAEQLRNEIVAQVREAWQNVKLARQSFEIQETSLRLADQRAQSIQMFFDAGREGITIRDQLDAEGSRLTARNALIVSLVEYTVQRLQFYYAIEALDIDQRGMWHETDEKKS